MSELRFEWDERKNRENQRKHRVSFHEARTVFWDERALLIADPEHSDFEERFLLLGLSLGLRVLVVCHCARGNGNLIRIISARKADKLETKDYERGARS